ncbi:hypothetical protein SAMN05421823_11644 [Catalinimonas alkaloidigena]|uniref:Uncharacterized protein n=1 Tax=Catalinimonas alkaloidigena TaxID=1075417 RepID=A0A1G9UES2_9BACT|nr:hypothetical protein [Catalinimonas alkaloidigena]SDM58450.1 hypothetical protein SAMN05421823_11644 [Catalinimonas alkaloidigena]
MRVLGFILAIVGAVALIITGIDYADNTDSFNVLGAEVTVSQGETLPLIISGGVLLLGIILVVAGGKKR